ncbi:unnamed protein product [Ascophyllum nodosum]
MKTVCVALALAVPCAGFMNPMANMRPTTSSSMTMSSSQPISRAQALNNVFASGAAAIAAAAVPGAAFGDGATSLATQARARGIYGSRIEGLKGAVDKGDTKAVLIEQSSFALFNSGVFSTNKTKFREAEKLAKAVVEAATLGDASALKSAYAAYFKYIEKKSGYSGATDGQGLGSEFDYKNRTPQGTVYQR